MYTRRKKVPVDACRVRLLGHNLSHDETRTDVRKREKAIWRRSNAYGRSRQNPRPWPVDFPLACMSPSHRCRLSRNYRFIVLHTVHYYAENILIILLHAYMYVNAKLDVYIASFLTVEREGLHSFFFC